MKRITVLLAIFLFAASAGAQDLFKVISVNGEIIATKANVTLENGVQVSSDDDFNFVVPNSRAAMINSNLGRVVLTEQNAADAFSRAAFAPAMSSISTRAGNISNSAELQNMFCENMLIIDKMEVSVGANVYPMGDQTFFYISYMYDNENINKRLEFSGDKFIVDKEAIFNIDGKPIDDKKVQELKLYYYKRTGVPESTLIASFSPLFISSAEIKPEIQIIVDELNNLPYNNLLAEVFEYLKAFYGVAERANLEAWMSKEFNVNRN
jgi:hypothetical protein